MPWNIMEYDGIWWSATAYDGMWWNVMEIWWKIDGNLMEIWWKMVDNDGMTYTMMEYIMEYDGIW